MERNSNERGKFLVGKSEKSESQEDGKSDTFRLASQVSSLVILSCINS